MNSVPGNVPDRPADQDGTRERPPASRAEDGQSVALVPLQRFPEGYDFKASLPNTATPSILLLSPPHLVAVRKRDGSWYRRARDETMDGPAPYGIEWYQRYLLESQLPPQLFHEEEAEEDLDGYEQPGVQNSVDYLQTRYPEQPQFPRPKRSIARGLLGLSADELRRVARHFPATILLKGQLDVVVHAIGYITIPDVSTAVLPRLSRDDVEWVTAEEDQITNNASYIILQQERSSDMPPPPVPRQDISGMKRAHSNAKTSSSNAKASFQRSSRHTASTTHQQNPPHQHTHPADNTHQDKLSEPAMPRNNSAEEVKRERSESEEALDEEILDDEHEPAQDAREYLPIDLLAEALKHTVEKGVPAAQVKREPGQHHVLEIPHLTQPTAKGSWKFVNPAISQAAVDCFANQAGFDTEGVDHPTAAHIFRVRESTQYYFNTGELLPLLGDDWEYHDPTLAIELSYVGDEAGRQTDWLPNQSEVPPPNFDFGIDKLSKLQHAPMNNGANDQRGLLGKAKYFTRNFEGTVVTLDRAVAAAGKSFQRHKAWIYRQRWERYNAEIDWSDRKSVDMLNKWRNQTLERDGWPLLRPRERKNYDAEQRTWLFKHIVIAGGQAPQEGFTKLTQRFNEHFGLEGEAARSRPGIAEVCKRLMREYEDHDGKQKPAVQKNPFKRAKISEGGEGEIEEEEEGEEEEGFDDPVMDRLLAELGSDDDAVEDERMDRILEAFGGDWEEES